MAYAQLGELSDVAIREVWEHEALDFTPWLAENLSRLSATLGVGLELEGTEVAVDKYRADIVCRVPTDGTKVLIENQLEHADLQHLGQVLAYLAGLDAKIVVWIAREFGDAHLSALHWLNEHTPDPFSFFAVKVGAVKIGDSLPAPVFEVIERPNDWDRQVRAKSDSLSKLGAFRRDFWAHLADRRPDAPGLRPGYAGSNVSHEIEELNLRVSQYISRDGVEGAGIFVKAGAGESEDYLSARLKPYLDSLREALEEESKRDGLGKVGDHTFRDDVVRPHMCWIGLYLDTRDRQNWDTMADWLEDRRKIYEAILSGHPGQME